MRRESQSREYSPDSNACLAQLAKELNFPVSTARLSGLVKSSKYKTVAAYSNRVKLLESRKDFALSRRENIQTRDLRKRGLNFHLFLTEKQSNTELAVAVQKQLQTQRLKRQDSLTDVLGMLRSVETNRNLISSASVNDTVHIIRNHFHYIPVEALADVSTFLAIHASESELGAQIASLVLKKVLSCTAHLTRDIPKLIGICCAVRKFERYLSAKQMAQLDELTIKQLRGGREVIPLPSLVLFVESNPNRTVLRWIKARLITDIEKAMKTTDYSKPSFSLFGTCEERVDHTQLMNSLLQYLTVLNQLGNRCVSPPRVYSDLTSALERFLSTNVRSDPLVKMKLIEVHASLGFRPLTDLGRRLVHDWLKSHSALLRENPTNLSIVYNCSEAVRYSHRFSRKRLLNACNMVGIPSKPGSVPSKLISVSNTLKRNRSIVYHRPFRRLLHASLGKARPLRLDRETVSRLSDSPIECGKRGCVVCSRFRGQLDIARAFHFPKDFI